MKTAVIEAGLPQMVAIGVGAGVGKLMGYGALTLGVARDCGRGAPPEPAVRRDQEDVF